jgi:dimethyl sulfoxide reductase membrane subunit
MSAIAQSPAHDSYAANAMGLIMQLGTNDRPEESMMRMSRRADPETLMHDIEGSRLLKQRYARLLDQAELEEATTYFVAKLPASSVKYSIWLAAMTLTATLGIVAWMIQQAKGFETTGISNASPWGLYIAAFVFFVGLGLGSLILASVPYALDMPDYKPFARHVNLTGLVSLLLGGLMVFADIGRPERVLDLLRNARVGSPMFWDIVVVGAGTLVSAMYQVRLARVDRGATVGRFAYVALVTGLLDGATALIFSTQRARPMWNSALLPVSFVASALSTALASSIALLLGLRRAGYVQVGDGRLARMGKALGAAVALTLVLKGTDLATAAFPQSESSSAELSEVLRGGSAAAFWPEVTATGAAAMILLLAPASRLGGRLLGCASALTLIGGAAKRFELVTAGLAVPNIDYPGVYTGPPDKRSAAYLQKPGASAYSPSGSEWTVVAGVTALGALLLSKGIRHIQKRAVLGR